MSLSESQSDIDYCNVNECTIHWKDVPECIFRLANPGYDSADYYECGGLIDCHICDKKNKRIDLGSFNHAMVLEQQYYCIDCDWERGMERIRKLIKN